MDKINLSEKLALFSDHWHPRIVGELTEDGAANDLLEDDIPMSLRGLSGNRPPRHLSVSGAEVFGRAVLSNGQQVKLAKIQGEFLWHQHDHEDELFLVVKGRFRMEFRNRQVWLEEGEMLIVPRWVEHRPVADEEAHILLFEPASTLNIGNVQNERTVAQLERI